MARTLLQAASWNPVDRRYAPRPNEAYAVARFDDRRRVFSDPGGLLVMRIISVFFALIIGAGLAAGCTGKTAAGQRELKQPVNCATARSDIAVLEHEKAGVAERVALGDTSVTPAGAVLGIVTLTEDDKLEVAVGSYNGKLDAKIAEIKPTTAPTSSTEPRKHRTNRRGVPEHCRRARS
jgi:hypothetical protein